MTRRLPAFPFALALLALALVFTARGRLARFPAVPVSPAIVVSNPFRLIRDTLQQGETVSALFAREGVRGLNLTALAATLRFDPRRIRAGLEFQVRRDGRTDEPTHIEFRSTPDERLRFIRTSSGEWRGEALPIRWTTDTVRVAIPIERSLFESLDSDIGDATLDHGERVRLAYDLAEVNDYSVDFSRDIQPGDRITAVIERQLSEEGEVRFGRTLASDLKVAGKTYTTFSYRGPDGKDAFYDANGEAVKRAFLVSPVQFRYISSGFSRARLHPILGIFRKHAGIDYAAMTGAPVHAAADGVVTAAGYSGGYGRLVEIRHSNGITTRYGHLSVIMPGIHPGARVSQGETVGKVGMSGLATGPHLHYEFRVDGVARDPRSVRSEPGAPLPSSLAADFQRNRAVLAELLGRGMSSAVAAITE